MVKHSGYSGAEIKQIRQIEIQGFPVYRGMASRFARGYAALDEDAQWEIFFACMQRIYRMRFMKENFVPKRRPFLFGRTPLQRGLDAMQNGELVARPPQLRPSLTKRYAKYAVRTKVPGQHAIHGTSYPWAALLHSGGWRGSFRYRAPKSAHKLRWLDDNRKQWTAQSNFDAGFYMPPRPFSHNLTPKENEYLLKTESNIWTEMTLVALGMPRSIIRETTGDPKSLIADGPW